ncbi:hypothetical protein D3C85_1612720 [compost metagenome]
MCDKTTQAAPLKVEWPDTKAGKLGVPVIVFIEGSTWHGLGLKCAYLASQQLIAASIIAMFSKAIFLAHRTSL